MLESNYFFRTFQQLAGQNFICFVLLIIGFCSSAFGAENIRVIRVQEVIGPATNDLIARNIKSAEEDNIELLIIKMDTPGGLLQSTREIISAILASKVPVATWVTPDGARAASAGTFIMYASHVAAMSTVTNMGSATPIKIQANTIEWQSDLAAGSKKDLDKNIDSEGKSGDKSEDKSGDKSALDKKIMNDTLAYIRNLAELRGRNAQWAEEAVRDASNLTAVEALAANVIDIIADNIDSLLDQVEGRKVKLGEAKVEKEIILSKRQVEEIEIDWRHKFISFISNPNIASIFMLLGIYGLIAEFYNPGSGIGGIGGVICLILAFFGLQDLPIDYVGLALMLLGIGFMIAEAFLPSFGIFGIGGTAAFAIGAVFLVDTDISAYQISIYTIVAMTLSSLLVCTVLVGVALKTRKIKVISGFEGLNGCIAVVTKDFDLNGHGKIRVEGEIWQAYSQSIFPKTGEKVKIIGINGLKLEIEVPTEVSTSQLNNQP